MATDDEGEQIGARLRAIRQAKGLSARELAERAGVTAAYLSRLENGRLSPTVASLTRIMQAAGESVGALFGQAEDADSPVVRRSARRLVRSHGVEDYRVTPAWADRLEVLETVITPGEGSGPSAYSHPGDQECVLIQEGSLTIWLEDAEFVLDAGDSITFSCRSQHRWANTARARTVALWMITPANY